MHSRGNIGLLFAVLLGLSGFGCNRPAGNDANPQPAPGQQPADEPKVTFPALGTPTRPEKGIDFYEVTLRRGDRPMKVWVYVPEHPADQKLPCVMVAPAGSPLVFGMNLSDGDRAEQLPYARAGFVVVSYEIDGHLPDSEKGSDRAVADAAKAFKDAKAGVSNARAALDFALERVTAVDPQRVYCAGHSSAATLSLLVASADPRIKGCAAFAPVTDVERRLGARTVNEFGGSIPGYAEFVKASSPRNNVAPLKCPVFLFHARDDMNVQISETRGFAEELKRTNPRVTFVEVPKGGHYNSMVREGIPQAIEWFRKLRA